MSTAVDFKPKYDHPFTLEQAIELEIDILIAEIARLENSIKHLRSTQTQIQSFINGDPANDDDGELSKAVAENEETIASQSERIDLIKVALLNKIGEGGVKHYGLEVPEQPPRPISTSGLPSTTQNIHPTGDLPMDDDAEGGLHL